MLLSRVRGTRSLPDRFSKWIVPCCRIDRNKHGSTRAAHARLAVSWQARAANPPAPSEGGAHRSMLGLLGAMTGEKSTHLLSSLKLVTSLTTIADNGVSPADCLSTPNRRRCTGV